MKKIMKETYGSIVKIVRNPKNPGLIKLYIDLPGTQKQKSVQQEMLVNVLSDLPLFINRIDRVRTLLGNIYITEAYDELGRILNNIGVIKDNEPSIKLINVQTLIESLNALYNRKP